ncbi:unnamed protein product [Brassicogethes aeneus]|uniref:Uncharacterized protein n=1 Tax=Brassicogethes aeneus TaxID=1431903 RepID=A0A9P0B288_BRAAE|nr:unnamed protein product [Brassicogethes aeneus]
MLKKYVNLRIFSNKNISPSSDRLLSWDKKKEPSKEDQYKSKYLEQQQTKSEDSYFYEEDLEKMKSIRKDKQSKRYEHREKLRETIRREIQEKFQK